MSLSERLAAVQRQYAEMERNIAELKRAAGAAEGSYQRLTRLVNQQIEEQERIVASLKYWWRWTLMIAFIGGFFGAVSSAAASWLWDGLVALLRSWWVG